jgi:hypothetical protein
MSELAREILPIAFMYGFAFLLAPFIGFAMWAAFDGDQLREPEVEVDVNVVPAGVAKAAPAKPAHREATTAA